jgi:hypothetical protein
MREAARVDGRPGRLPLTHKLVESVEAAARPVNPDEDSF